MKILCLILLFDASLQLQCDKREITAHIGGEFVLVCKYDTNRYLFSKKYWCRGESRNTCEILADSEHPDERRRSNMIDSRTRGLFVKVTSLQFDDTGAYWVGIDKIYADIMTSVNVVVTESKNKTFVPVPVSKPRLWPLSSLVDRLTCWGQPVTVRCDCTKGTGIHYAWYQRTHHEDLLLHLSSDLHLHCGAVEKDSDYYCIASNDISSQGSDILSVQVLMPADNSCIYVVNMHGQPIYNCADRMTTTTAKTTTLTSCQATMTVHTDTGNQSLQINKTHQDLFWVWSGMPLWYALLRWGSFASLLISLWFILKYTKTRHKKRAKRGRRRRRRAHVKKMQHLAH
ncbi:LOW QUALITY PROTEIN: uncharacterized protein LOC108888262 [Lates calcarifer]|uniref:LOW QUALITY PROTEIN: uncharacterized protein LOC108888262 n=1 Tax=Lates calcarifer TaxID=8187 RepID=A0AAJ8DQG3_LATCA|nr:LOW QUALITY PROTEIN: uncharacterized protein LOC108888262 [Lates calcarifer]